ncbi:MAG TPA: DUF2809 domain-containing protein [Polyangiaceae bacterium]|nr:DUF2809 domain-containing protein [Polyangiaceae bacterium]
MSRTLRAWAVALSFAAGAFVAVYRGPGWRPLRSHGGDVVATFFLLLLLGLLPRLGSAPRRAVATAAVALGLELLQAAGVLGAHNAPATQFLLGSTFDPWDCVAYAAGIALGLAFEAAASRPGVARVPAL